MTVSIMRLNNNTRKFLKWAAVALLWLAIWQLASAAVGKELLIPSPKAAFLSFKELCVTVDFWLAVLLSVLRIIAGYLSGVLAGVAGAVLSARFSAFKAVFSPTPLTPGILSDGSPIKAFRSITLIGLMP